jgi:hypothetical protein
MCSPRRPVVHDDAAQEVRQAQHRDVPARTHVERTRATAGERDRDGVLELQRGAVAVCGQPQVDDALRGAHVTVRWCGASHRRISPPTFPSSWYVPPGTKVSAVPPGDPDGGVVRRARCPRASSVASPPRARPRTGGTARTSRRPPAAAPRRRRTCAGSLGPDPREAVVPEDPQVLRDPGWEMPNSSCTAAVIAPENSSLSASSSVVRRRTGSPRTSNPCRSESYDARPYKSVPMDVHATGGHHS